MHWAVHLRFVHFPIYMLYLNNEHCTHIHILFSDPVKKAEALDHHPSRASNSGEDRHEEKQSESWQANQLSFTDIWHTTIMETFNTCTGSTYSLGTSLPGKESSEHISCLSHTPTTITAEIQKCKDRDSHPTWVTFQHLLSTENTEAWDLTCWDVPEACKEAANCVSEWFFFFQIKESQRNACFLYHQQERWEIMSSHSSFLAGCRPNPFLRGYRAFLSPIYPGPNMRLAINLNEENELCPKWGRSAVGSIRTFTFMNISEPLEKYLLHTYCMQVGNIKEMCPPSKDNMKRSSKDHKFTP